MSTPKAREDRLRRAAERQGYHLVKSRRRDPRARDYGKFTLIDDELAEPIVEGFPFDLDAIEALLKLGRWKGVKLRDN
jgi:hypothetical protein